MRINTTDHEFKDIWHLKTSRKISRESFSLEILLIVLLIFRIFAQPLVVKAYDTNHVIIILNVPKLIYNYCKLQFTNCTAYISLTHRARVLQ